MPQIMLKSAQFGCYELTLLEGKELSILIQTDWDFPGLASSFGWIACDCGATDGTVDCKRCHRTISQMIAEAIEYLDDHENAIIEDPGYFTEANLV